MISYVIYFFVFVILSFVIYLAAKAVKRGLDAKNVNKNFEKDVEKKITKMDDFINQLNEIKKYLIMER